MTAPKAHINVSGTWKQINKMHINVSGTWKQINKAYVNVSGTWKQFLGASVAASSFSGLFQGNAATNNITTATRTYTLGSGNSGQINFNSVAFDGTTFMYSKNGGAFANITEGLTITLANTDTLAVRAEGMTVAGMTAQCIITDVDTGTSIGSPLITRT